jgi:hypothetical protein
VRSDRGCFGGVHQEGFGSGSQPCSFTNALGAIVEVRSVFSQEIVPSDILARWPADGIGRPATDRGVQP